MMALLTNKWVRIILIIAAIVGIYLYQQHRIEQLVKDNTLMEQENTVLTESIEETERRVRDLGQSISNLNTSYGQSYERQQESYGEIVTDIPDGQAPDTQTMRDRANEGINALFDDLEAMSKGTENEE